MEHADNGEKSDSAWVEPYHGASSTSNSSKDVQESNDQNSATSSRTELTDSDKAQSGNVVSTRGIAVPRPNVKSKSAGAVPVDKTGTQAANGIRNVGPRVPLSEKRAASISVTPFSEEFSVESPGPSSTDQVSSKAIATESRSVEMKSIARAASSPLSKLPLPPLRKPAEPSSEPLCCSSPSLHARPAAPPPGMTARPPKTY